MLSLAASLLAPGSTSRLSLSPNLALLLASAGALLLFLECNRPGYILPGATGLLLLLLGTHTLAGLPPRPGSLCLLALACAVLALPLRRPVGWPAALAGSAILCLALATLSRNPARLSPALGIACALLLGPLAGWLAIAAGKARRAKFRLRSPERRHLPADRERWE